MKSMFVIAVNEDGYRVGVERDQDSSLRQPKGGGESVVTFAPYLTSERQSEGQQSFAGPQLKIPSSIRYLRKSLEFAFCRRATLTMANDFKLSAILRGHEEDVSTM